MGCRLYHLGFLMLQDFQKLREICFFRATCLDNGSKTPSGASAMWAHVSLNPCIVQAKIKMWLHFCKPFSYGLGCFGYCCGPCLVKRNADDLGKPGFLYCLLSCCIPCVPIFILRQEAREKYGIEGSTGEDALCSFFCASCTNCQTAVEIEGRGDHS